MTTWWNEVTKGWNEVVWNEVAMERSDWIPFEETNLLKFNSGVGEEGVEASNRSMHNTQANSQPSPHKLA